MDPVCEDDATSAVLALLAHCIRSQQRELVVKLWPLWNKMNSQALSKTDYQAAIAVIDGYFSDHASADAQALDHAMDLLDEHGEDTSAVQNVMRVLLKGDWYDWRLTLYQRVLKSRGTKRDSSDNGGRQAEAKRHRGGDSGSDVRSREEDGDVSMMMIESQNNDTFATIARRCGVDKSVIEQCNPELHAEMRRKKASRLKKHTPIKVPTTTLEVDERSDTEEE